MPKYTEPFPNSLPDTTYTSQRKREPNCIELSKAFAADDAVRLGLKIATPAAYTPFAFSVFVEHSKELVARIKRTCPEALRQMKKLQAANEMLISKTVFPAELVIPTHKHQFLSGKVVTIQGKRYALSSTWQVFQHTV